MPTTRRALLLVTDPAGGPSAAPALVPPARGRVAELVRTRRPRARRRCSVGCSPTRSSSTDWRDRPRPRAHAARLVAVTPDGIAARRNRPVASRRGGPGTGVTQAALDEAIDAGHRRRSGAGRGGTRGRVGAGRAGRRAGERTPAGHDRRAPRRCSRRGSAEVDARLAARDPEAQATAERHRRALLERDDVVSAASNCRLAELRARVDALHERLRDARRRHAEAARASADQLDGLRARARRVGARAARGARAHVAHRDRGRGSPAPARERDRDAAQRVRRRAARCARRARADGPRRHDACRSRAASSSATCGSWARSTRSRSTSTPRSRSVTGSFKSSSTT